MTASSLDLEGLRRELAELDGADPTERAHAARCLSLIERGPAATRRSHFDPGHFTASAFVLSPDGASLLLIFHGKLHRWLQPGGHIDAVDRNAAEAAARELREETGLASFVRAHPGIFDVDIHEIPARKGDPCHEHFDLRYLFQAQQREVVAGSDARGVRWVALDEVQALESDASVMRAVRKLQAIRGARG